MRRSRLRSKALRKWKPAGSRQIRCVSVARAGRAGRVDRRHQERTGGVLRRPDEADGRRMTALWFVLVASIVACARADHPDPIRTKAESNQATAAGSDAMTQAQTLVTCDAA